MIFNPITAGKGGSVKEVRVKRSGYEVDWTITIGGVKYTLKNAEDTLQYSEGQKIEVPSNAKSTIVTVGDGRILLEFSGWATPGVN